MQGAYHTLWLHNAVTIAAIQKSTAVKEDFKNGSRRGSANTGNPNTQPESLNLVEDNNNPGKEAADEQETLVETSLPLSEK